MEIDLEKTIDEKIENTQVARALKFYGEKVVDNGKDFYCCKLCKKVKNGTKRSNLVNHMQKVHEDAYKKFINNKEEKNKLELKAKRLLFLQTLVELVTVDKQQFLILSKPSFQKLVADKLKIFSIADMGINLDDKNFPEVKRHIHETANKIRQKLSSETQQKLFSMSTDAVSKNNRSILGIFIQYVNNDLVKQRCVGMKELKQRHTGKYFCEVIESCLKGYDLNLNQVASLTTDNAGNMRTLLKNMNENLMKIDDHEKNNNNNANQNINAQTQADACDFTVIVNCNEEIAEALHVLDNDDDNEIAFLLGDANIDDDDNWQQDDISQLNIPAAIKDVSNSSPVFINGISCAAHTVQLAVKDALSMVSIQHSNVIKLAREVAKFLRKENTQIEIRNRKLESILPSLDVETRWSSTYLLVGVLFENKSILDNH